MTLIEIEALLDDDLPDITDIVNRPAWMRDAACNEHPELSWMPKKGQSVDEAKAVCDGCLVRHECLAYSMSFGETPPGVWGGLSGPERKAIPRPRRRARDA